MILEHLLGCKILWVLNFQSLFWRGIVGILDPDLFHHGILEGLDLDFFFFHGILGPKFFFLRGILEIRNFDLAFFA